METIHIAYLYFDILNLYGENGNIKALKKEFENQGVKAVIHFLTIDDELKFSDYDLVYMGASTENNQKLVLPHLKKYKKEIKEAIKNKKFFFITGNSIELFGKYILTLEQEKIEALNIFDYYAIQKEKRSIDECIMKCDFLDKPIIGFQNQCTVMYDNNKPLFDVIKGINDTNNEGIKHNNFYGTYVLGPVLARNPELLKHLIKEVLLSKNNKFKFKKFDLELNEEAYNCFVNNFYQNIN